MTKSLIFAWVVVAGLIGRCMPATAIPNSPQSATPNNTLQTHGPYLLFFGYYFWFIWGSRGYLPFFPNRG